MSRRLQLGAAVAVALAVAIGVRVAQPSRTSSISQADLAKRSQHFDPSREQDSGGSEQGKDWTTPFNGAGTQVASVAEAQQLVTFKILAPQRFVPAKIFANSSVDVVGFSFNLPNEGNGWVQLVETKTTATALQYQQNFLAAAAQQPGFFSSTTLDTGRVAATMAAANGIGRLLWVDNGVQFDITGEGISPAQVTSLVSQMLYGGR
jgi:hypothetical protein